MLQLPVSRVHPPPQIAMFLCNSIYVPDVAQKRTRLKGETQITWSTSMRLLKVYRAALADIALHLKRWS